MSSHKCAISGARRLKFVFFFVFAAVPSLLLYIAWDFFSQQQILAEKGVAISEVRRDLLRLRRDGADRLYIQRCLNFFYGNLAEEDYQEKTIEDSLTRFREDGLDFINFRFFKADGYAMNFKGQAESRRAVLQKIFDALRQVEMTGKHTLLLRNRLFFDAFVGGIDATEISREKSSLLRVMMNGKPGYFYWNAFYSQEPEARFTGGFIAWFREADMPKNLALKHLVDSINFEWRGQRAYGLVNLAESANSLPSDGKISVSALAQVDIAEKLVQLRNNFESQAEINGHLLVAEFFTPDKILYCLCKIPGDFYENVAMLLKILALVWLLIVAHAGAGAATRPSVTVKTSVDSVCFGLSMRQFTVFFAGAVPSLLILFLGAQFRDTHVRMLTQDAFANLSAKIASIDENYQVAVRNLEVIYRRVAGLKAFRELDVEELDRLAAELSDKDALNRIHIADRSGKMRYSWPPTRRSGDIISKIIPAVTRRIFISQRGDTESFQDKISDVMMDSFTESYADVLGDVGTSLLHTFENLDCVNEFWLGNHRNYVYTSFVERGTDKDPWLLYIWHGTKSFAQRYLQKQIQRNIDDAYSLKIPVQLAMVPRQRSRLPFPRDFNKYPFVTQLAEQIVDSEAQQYLTGSMAGEKCLIVAAPLKRIPDHFLFAMYSYNLIEQQALKLTAMLYFAAFLCFAAAAALACVIDDL